MKKLKLFILVIFSSLLLLSCGNKETKPDFEITTNFGFYKDGSKQEKYESSEFEINTKIYVAVDFSIKKNVDTDETISFVVQIPYAEYYSTKDFYKGPIIPDQNLYNEYDSNGTLYSVMELNRMNFVLADNNIHEYHYIFEIMANQVCKNAEFKVRFKPENTNLNNITVNGSNTNLAKTTYTFKEKGE